MNRNASTMLLCVVLGAVVMYGSSNFRINITPVNAPPATPEVKIAPTKSAAPHEPAPLPASVTKPGDAPRVDPNVQAAQSLQPALFPQAVGVEKVTESVTVAGTSQNVIWNPPTAGNPQVYLLTRNPTIVLRAATAITKVVVTQSAPVLKSVASDAPGATWFTPATVNSVALDFRNAPLQDYTGPVRVEVYAGTAVVASIDYRVPMSAPASPPLIVSHVQNSPFANPASLATLGSTRVVAYGVTNTFLQLQGQRSSSVNATKFIAHVASGPVFDVANTASSPAVAAPGWNERLTNIPVYSQGTNGFVAARAELGADHIYATDFVAFNAATVVSPLGAPKVTDVAKPTATPGTSTPLTTIPGSSVYTSNDRKLVLTIQPPPGAQAVLIYVDGALKVTEPVAGVSATAAPGDGAGAPIPKTIELPVAIKNVVRVTAMRGAQESDSALLEVKVRTDGPSVESVLAPGFGSSAGVGTEKIQIRFNADNPLNATEAKKKDSYRVIHNESDAATKRNALKDGPLFDAATNTVTLTVDSIKPGSYDVLILNAGGTPTAAEGGTTVGPSPGIVDVYGNPIVKALGEGAVAYRATLFTAQVDQPLPSQRAGVTLQTGPSVALPEYVKFRVSPDGFNPSDRVETRVVRLYYYRDGHRVAQLVNRTVKSYNAATVDVRRRVADRARDDADKAEDERKKLEWAAVKAAQDARAAEGDLAAVQNRLATAKNESAQAQNALAQKRFQLQQAQAAGRTTEVQRLEFEIAQTERTIITSDSIERRGAADLATAQSAVAAKRDTEGKAVEAWQVKDLQERRYRENQFRREVGAAKEDPDTYGPAQPESVDPVLQVSISVIGEGLIQLRGPIKGLNVIRTMVNQIDAPVGQVRVSVHTLQVNGERADRMEKVVQNIQRYLDHSRFLTAQSSQMLRRAVTNVAARKANEAAQTLAPGCTQWDRDQKYLHAFFGKDFIDELILLDSEFLKTGNKLLGLHSMDSTSLSSALFLLALAKNDIRAEIVQEFMSYVQRELPQAEWNYYAAGFSDLKWKHCDACKDKKQYLLAYNSKFQSFIGFFTSETEVADTLSPLQREFIRLAQIFKARMITEMQLKQRVMERALLEERVGTNYIEELKNAKKLEDDAKAELSKFQNELQAALGQANKGLVELRVLLDEAEAEINIGEQFASVLNNILISKATGRKTQPGQIKTRTGIKEVKVPQLNGPSKLPTPKNGALTPGTDIIDLTPAGIEDLLKGYSVNLEKDNPEVITAIYNAGGYLALFKFLGSGNDAIYQRIQKNLSLIRKTPTSVPVPLIRELSADMKELSTLISSNFSDAKGQLGKIVELLTQASPDPVGAVGRYNLFRDDIKSKLTAGKPLAESVTRIFNESDPSFKKLAATGIDFQIADKKARAARRPLDEKKLLDMMVDELEDKFIEILEGTRAHTANIDNYMKTITTALDDDFNTQYYLPSFRRAREASRSWDVTLGQIETTSVLANNRTFAKVSPSATFEFDLPKRDILLTEGFKSAKALVDEYGALMSDPSFLSLAKMYSGNPVSMMQQGGGGLASVRNVLPGLSSSPDEKIMAQAGPGRKEFGSSLEALIPDPAIYKFETGTGYEIRPVLSPDGQAVVFNFDYMYTTDVREPVRADEKHLGRVKRHFVHTDVQLSNFELREVSKYMVAIKVARTGKGVQLLQDIPGVGVLFRPLPSAGASLQQNLIYSQATIFPTLFDLMGLRYAPAVADLDPLADRMSEYAARYRRLDLEQRVYDIGASRVDDALRTPYGERRYDLYRPQIPLPFVHPNGYYGMGLRMRDGYLREGYDPSEQFRESQFNPNISGESRPQPYDYRAPYGPAQLPPYNVLPSYPLGDPRQSYPLPNPKPFDGNPLPKPKEVPKDKMGAVRPNATGPTDAMLRDPRVPINFGRPVPPPSSPPAREIPTERFPPVVTPGLPPLPGVPGGPTTLPPLPR